MTEYSNSKRSRDEKQPAPPKSVEKVIVGEVVIQKKSFGRKFKETFIKSDLRSVTRYVISDVLVPSVINMFVDSVKQSVDRMFYGDRAVRRSMYGPSRITYQTPVSRGYSPIMARLAPPVDLGPRRASRHDQGDVILERREEAEIVLERMNDIIDTHEVVSLADLKALIGAQSVYTDNNWGWINLSDVQIRQIREGFLIDLPPAEPITSN